MMYNVAIRVDKDEYVAIRYFSSDAESQINYLIAAYPF